jgi:D-alanyl-D-alanine dipeptidase
MGTAFDDLTERAGTVYFEKKNDEAGLSEEETNALRNRRALWHLMKSVGLENYCEEWWHYDFGDQNWAWNMRKDRAVYGMTSPDLPWLETK